MKKKPCFTNEAKPPTHHEKGITSRKKGELMTRCNRLRCPLARMSGLQCINMGHNGHGINMYGVSMTLLGN